MTGIVKFIRSLRLRLSAASQAQESSKFLSDHRITLRSKSNKKYMNAEKLKILVVDDEALARRRITNLLQSLKQSHEVYECSNGLEALTKLEDSEFDLIFLDIQMPEMNGFEVLENIEMNNTPPVIFVTAYDQYALRAFEIHAIDYLLKPFDDDRFYEAFENAKNKLFKHKAALVNLEKLLQERRALDDSHYNERIIVKNKGRIYFVKCNDVITIKAAGKYLQIITDDDEHSVRQTMNDIESKLDPKVFLRIHRSTIINIDRIREMQHWYKNEYIFIMTNGDKVTSGSTYRKNLDVLLNENKKF
jgi:two-component system LytT family response regulator